jgi:hypothetical protein
MEKTIMLSVAGDDLQALKDLKKTLTSEPGNDIAVENAHLNVTPGVIGTAAILTMALTYLSGVSSKILASWLYDKFIKAKSTAPKFEIYINNVKIDTTTADSPVVVQEQLDQIASTDKPA